MASFTETKYAFKVRFYSSKRSPKEKSISLSKDAWTKREAKSYKRELEVGYDRFKQFGAGADGAFDPWTDALPHESDGLGLRAAIDRYIAHKRLPGRRDQQGGWNEATYHNYRIQLHDFARFTGERKPVHALTTDDLGAYIFQSHLADDTRRSYRRILKTFVGWLRREGLHERLFSHKSPNKLYRGFKAAAERALPNKPDVDYHSLRHGGIIHWLEQGYSYRDLKNFARHKSVKTTEGYDQYVAEGARRRADRL